jgi:hypothetical protein
MAVDALILVGFNRHDLISKTSKSFAVQGNGQMKRSFGEAEEYGVIYDIAVFLTRKSFQFFGGNRKIS